VGHWAYSRLSFVLIFIAAISWIDILSEGAEPSFLHDKKKCAALSRTKLAFTGSMRERTIDFGRPRMNRKRCCGRTF
jgi:hypothetical protein